MKLLPKISSKHFSNALFSLEYFLKYHNASNYKLSNSAKNIYWNCYMLIKLYASNLELEIQNMTYKRKQEMRLIDIITSLLHKAGGSNFHWDLHGYAVIFIC